MKSFEGPPSGLTLDEFAMGYHAHLQAAAGSDRYRDESASWDAHRSIEGMQAMSDADPDFHTALTDANPQSQEARHDDIRARVIVARACGFSGLPESPTPAEFDALLRATSLGPFIRSKDWY